MGFEGMCAIFSSLNSLTALNVKPRVCLMKNTKFALNEHLFIKQLQTSQFPALLGFSSMWDFYIIFYKQNHENYNLEICAQNALEIPSSRPQQATDDDS